MASNRGSGLAWGPAKQKGLKKGGSSVERGGGTGPKEGGKLQCFQLDRTLKKIQASFLPQTDCVRTSMVVVMGVSGHLYFLSAQATSYCTPMVKNRRGKAGSLIWVLW